MTSKKIILIIVVGLILAVSFSIYKYYSDSKSAQDSAIPLTSDQIDSSLLKITPEPSVSNPQESPVKGGYVVFDNSIFSSISTPKRLLFFYASWCPTCRPTDKDITDNVAQIPSDLTIIRVNYKDTDTDESEKKLAEKYAVSYQHTFVQIDENGNEVAKWNGGNFANILKNLK